MSHVYRFCGIRTGQLSWVLEEEEHFHALKVLRLTSGSEIEIADGKGWTSRAIITSVGKSTCTFDIHEESYAERLSNGPEIIIALGATKPQSCDEFLPSLVELGVDEIVIFSSESGDKYRMSEKIQERCDRIIKSACKQCKRPWFPRLVWAESVQEVVELFASHDNSSKFVLDPDGSDYSPTRTRPVRTILAVIGSEKGFTLSELSKLDQAGFERIRIGSFILRTVTAAIAATSIFAQSRVETLR